MKNSHAKLAALAAVLLPVGVLAAEPTTRPARPAAEASTAAKADTRAQAKDEQHCSPTATTHIRRPKSAQCEQAADASVTRRYSKEDLESTGKFDTVDALRQLDTRVQ